MVPVFPNKGFFGVYMSSFGACTCRMLVDVCFIIVTIKQILDLADQRAHAPTFKCVRGCVVKAKLVKLLIVMFILNQSIYAHMHLLFIT